MVGRARAITGGQAFIPFNVGGTAATLDVDFTRSAFVGVSGTSAFTVTRTGAATSGLSTDATGSSYTSFPANTMRIVSGSGLLIEETRTQYLGVTDAPATQTTASLGTGSYTLWVIGTGSATPSAGTATITGAAAATAGSPNTFTVTVAGTVTVTVSGSLTRFQLENGAFATSYIPNHGAAGTSVTRGAEVISLQSTNFSSWYTNATAGSIICEYVQLFRNTGSNKMLATITDNTINNRASIFVQSDGLAHGFRLTNGAVATFNVNGGITNLAGATCRAAMAWDGATSGNAASRGILVGADDATVTAPTSPNRLYLGVGEAGSGSATNGFVLRVSFFPTRISNANLQALTA